MKQNFNWMCAALAFAGVCTFTACSDDDEAQVFEFPELPENVEQTQVGQSFNLEFDAYADWTISADQTWVKFKMTDSKDEPTVSLSGKAGEQKVTYIVSDENMAFEPTTAKITLAMDGKKDTMMVSRVAKERIFEMYAVTESESGFAFNPAETLAMDYNDNAESYHVKYAVRSNYKWVMDAPEWIEVTSSAKSGEPNSDVANNEDLKMYYLNINSEKVTLDDMSGFLKFKDYDAAEGTPAVDSVAITCAGTKSWNRFVMALPEVVNFNGQGMYENPDMGMEMDVIRFSTLTGKDNGYKFYFLPKQNGWFGVTGSDYMFHLDATDPGLNWMGIDSFTDEYPAYSVNSYELWATPAKEDREVVFLAIPEEVANGIEVADSLLNGEGSEILPQYTQYIVSVMTQTKGQADAALEFSMGQWLPDGVDGITIEPMGDEELGRYSGNFGVQKGYVVTYNSFDMYTSSQLKFGDIDAQCVVAFTDPDIALYDGKGQGWLNVAADMGFQGFMFDFTNKFVPFSGPRQATVVLMDPDAGQCHVVIRVVQNVDNGNTEGF